MKKIIINNLEFDDVKDACEYILEEMDEKYYDEFLDEGQEEIQIGCCTFSPSYVLSQCDPIAYCCGRDDFKEFVREEIEYWLEQEATTLYGFDIEYEEIEEEE